MLEHENERTTYMSICMYTYHFQWSIWHHLDHTCRGIGAQASEQPSDVMVGSEGGGGSILKTEGETYEKDILFK
jgi:hypothetical protein